MTPKNLKIPMIFIHDIKDKTCLWKALRFQQFSTMVLKIEYLKLFSTITLKIKYHELEKTLKFWQFFDHGIKTKDHDYKKFKFSTYFNHEFVGKRLWLKKTLKMNR